MKYVVFLLMLLAFTSCNKLKLDASLSAGVKKKITTFAKHNSCKDIQADEYRFNTELVYVLSPGTCGADMLAEVIDDQGETLGNIGGIAGNMEIKGGSFTSAEFVRTVWKR